MSQIDKAKTIRCAISYYYRSSQLEEMELSYDLEQLIIKFIKDTVAIIHVSTDENNEEQRKEYIIRPHILTLCPKLRQRWDECQDYLQPILLIETEIQVGAPTFDNIMKYLEHHNGKEPAPLPCPVRSTDMKQIVSDPWDAEYLKPFNKKQIFEIILGANKLDIKCLLHLGCAKIATLIKQLDQKEINRIIEEEERYRQQHANDQNDQNDQNNQMLDLQNDIAPYFNDDINLQNQNVQINQNQYQNTGFQQVQQVQPENLYQNQLNILNDMGFTDQNTNLNALISSGGNVDAAIDIILS